MGSETAVLSKGVLLGVKEKCFAAAHGGRIELQNAFDERIGFRGEAPGGTDLRDQTNLLRAARIDRLAKQNQGEGEVGKSVLTEVGHDGGRGKAVAHLGESEGRVLSDEREVAQNGKSEAETKGVALDLGDADQRRGAQGGFELEDTSRFAPDCSRGAPRTLASCAENITARANAQDAGARF